MTCSCSLCNESGQALTEGRYGATCPSCSAAVRREDRAWNPTSGWVPHVTPKGVACRLGSG